MHRVGGVQVYGDPLNLQADPIQQAIRTANRKQIKGTAQAPAEWQFKQK